MYTKVMTAGLCLALVGVSRVLAQQPAVETVPALEMTARQRDWLKATVDQRIRLAEGIGEEGAQAFAAKKGYKPILTKADKALPQGFDQIYRAKDGGIVVIEAKGGTSAIGRAYGYQQGSPDWAVQAARRVADSSKATIAEKHAAKLVLEAARDSRLTVQVVQTRHVLGEPVAAVLESTLKAGQAQSKAAATILEEIALAGRASQSAGQAAKSAEAASKAVRGASTLSKVGKAAGVVGVAVDTTIRVNSAVETEKNYRTGKISNDQRITAHAKNGAGMVGGFSGAWAGAKGGAVAGGAVGAMFGGVGAPIGAAVGGGVGAISGYFGGEYVGEKLVDGLKSLWK